jgi:hypothetical protein
VPEAASALRRAKAVWVTFPEQPARLVWQVWADGCSYVLCGGREQSLPGAADAVDATVTVRAADGSVCEVAVEVERTDEWDSLLPKLLAARLNLTDPDTARRDWPNSCLLLRLRPRAG